MTKTTRTIRINGMPDRQPRTRKKKVTDRAQRYRANQKGVKPKGKSCAHCGSTRSIVVNHKDGNESNTRSSNLNLLCKSCNAKEAARHKAAGQGRRTAQYNPKKKAKAKTRRSSEKIPTFNQYLYALSVHRPLMHDEGGKIIHATPPHIRREYAQRIADFKKERRA